MIVQNRCSIYCAISSSYLLKSIKISKVIQFLIKLKKYLFISRFFKKFTFNQSWLRDGIFSWSRIPILGIRNRDFYFGLGQKILKIPKSRESGSWFENHEKIPIEKSQKSRGSGSGFENPEKIPKIRKSGGSGFIFS